MTVNKVNYISTFEWKFIVIKSSIRIMIEEANSIINQGNNKRRESHRKKKLKKVGQEQHSTKDKENNNINYNVNACACVFVRACLCTYTCVEIK